ncbi:MAG: SDR family NAD(P)-dependent oxidoreductase [Ignavibacteriales bacterium]|nr:SDR family NAD(P)-dependent oxidoreductase [Ignavibacteriales bacterium]
MQIALVTGGNRGIGFEVARQLGGRGFQVWIASRNASKGNKAAETLRGEGLHVSFVEMDVSRPEGIATAYKTFSGTVDHLDVLVNNAGVVLDEGGNLLHLPVNKILETIQTNAVGPLVVVQTFAPLLGPGSRVINVSSGAGEIGNGISTYAPAYSISKTALNAVTCQLAHALRSERIAVNAVCPGWVRTDMGGRIAPRSVKKGAETIVWLATDSPIRETGKFWRDKRTIPW